MNDFLNAFIKIDAIKSTSVGGEESWIFEGIASTDDMDLYDEVIYPESFLNSIDFFKANGKIFFDHEYAKKPDSWLEKWGFSKEDILSLKTPIGKPLEAKLTANGLYIKGILNKEHPMAKKMWTEFLTNPDVAFRDQIGLSIGAKYMGTPRREYDVKKGKYVTYLPDLLLYEVSMTPEPVNPNTRTWATVVKSMLDEASMVDKKKDIQHHTIKPESVLFDQENNRLVIKSIVEGGDGTKHVFESYIDIREDIRNVMAEDTKVTLKAFPGQEEDDKAEKKEAPAQEGESKPATKPEDFGGEVASGEVEETADPLEGMEPELGGDMEAGAEMPMGDAPMGDPMAAPGEEAGAGSILDTLVGGEEGGELGADGMGDASMDMVLDKQDTMLDLLGQILDALHGSAMEQETPMEPQVTQQPPSAELLKSIISDTLSGGGATVNLSEESTKEFGEALKGVLEGFEDRIVEKLVLKLTNETTVIKSASKGDDEKVVIKHPGVSVSGESNDSISPITLKAVSDEEDERVIDPTVLKSFIDGYTAVRGYNSAVIQKRANILKEATKTLNINDDEFRYFVRRAEKGQL